jgi:hypothetical protein
MLLRVLLPHGMTITLNVEASDTIHNIKVAIRSKEFYPVNDQRLFRETGDLELEDGRTLTDYDIQEDQRLRLGIRGRGGAGKRKADEQKPVVVPQMQDSDPEVIRKVLALPGPFNVALFVKNMQERGQLKAYMDECVAIKNWDRVQEHTAKCVAEYAELNQFMKVLNARVDHARDSINYLVCTGMASYQRQEWLSFVKGTLLAEPTNTAAMQA